MLKKSEMNGGFNMKGSANDTDRSKVVEKIIYKIENYKPTDRIKIFVYFIN